MESQGSLKFLRTPPPLSKATTKLRPTQKENIRHEKYNSSAAQQVQSRLVVPGQAQGNPELS
jgi:hypothetical protein